MARTRPSLTERRIAKLIAEGRGQGEGKDYRPWIRVARGEISSKGRSRRIRGFKTGRTHHLLSDLEFYIFLTLEFSPLVKDIREQYPLFPRQEVIDLAQSLDIRHPIDPKTKVPYILTSDFLVTLDIPEMPHAVISGKYVSSIEEDPRVCDLLELERRVWLGRNVPFWLCTDKDIPSQLIKNLDWLHQGAVLPERLKKAIPPFLKYIQQHHADGVVMREYFNQLSNALRLASEDAYRLFKHCVWTHRLSINLDGVILPTEKFPVLREAIGSDSLSSYSEAV